MSYVDATGERPPSLIAPTLGAVTRSGVTIDYYANQAELKWSSGGLKQVHDTLMGIDFGLRSLIAKIPIEMLSMLGLSKGQVEDLKGLRAYPCPLAAPLALLLEFCAGGRRWDSSTRGLLLWLRDGCFGSAGLAVVLGLVCAGIGLLISAGVVTAAVGLPLAAAGGVIATGGVVMGALGAIFGALAGGQKPDKAQFTTAMKKAAELSKKPVTQAEIDLAYAGACAGAQQIAAVTAGGSASVPAGTTAKTTPGQAYVLSADELKSIQQMAAQHVVQQQASSGIPPIAIVGAAVVAFLALRRR